jgi:hypothetical protein
MVSTTRIELTPGTDIDRYVTFEPPDNTANSRGISDARSRRPIITRPGPGGRRRTRLRRSPATGSPLRPAEPCHGGLRTLTAQLPLTVPVPGDANSSFGSSRGCGWISEFVASKPCPYTPGPMEGAGAINPCNHVIERTITPSSALQPALA